MKQNVIVSLIDEFDDISVKFKNGLVVGVEDPNMLKIFYDLQEMSKPAYVEIDDYDSITRLLIPLTFKVINISGGEMEDINVEFEISHAKHFLRRDNPDFDEILEILRSAQEEDEWLIVTETDDHEIIDVRY